MLSSNFTFTGTRDELHFGNQSSYPEVNLKVVVRETIVVEWGLDLFNKLSPIYVYATSQIT